MAELVEVNEGIAMDRLDAAAEEQEELKRRESELMRLNERLKELDRAKTEFFSNVSREFRTPLTLLVGPLQDILDSPASALAPESRTVLEVARSNALRLLKLVDTLLDFSPIKGDQTADVLEPIDLAEFTAELAGNFRSTCEWAGLNLVVDCPALPGLVYVDRERWEKIVLNLIANAFKFTLEGAIEVRLQALEGAVRLTVRDTGSGIPAGELPHLFDRSRRVAGARASAPHEGGIGLAMVRDLVQAQGGSIEVESTPGQGSIYTVMLPLGAHAFARSDDKADVENRPGVAALDRKAFDGNDLFDRDEKDLSAEKKLPVVKAGFGPNGLIVVADDNADMRAYLTHLLEAAGFEVNALEDGTAALAACQACPPDAVISDVLMPGLDGFALIERLRADERTAVIPVLLLSGRAGEDSRIAGLAAGADDYLVKPFGRRELVARVEGAIRLSRMRREVAQRELADFESLFSMAPDGVIVVGGDGKVLAANERAQQLFGYSQTEFMRLQVEALIPQDRRVAHVGTRAGYVAGPVTRPMSPTKELRALRRDGSEFVSEIGLAPLQFKGQSCTIAIIRDPTERKQFEQKLIEAQKLEAMGRLTGGLAHDFNNLLGIILGNLDLIEPSLVDEKARSQRNLAVQAGMLAAQITKSLLAVARKQTLEPRKISIKEILFEMMPLIRQTVGNHITVQDYSFSEAYDAGALALVDPSGLNNAILNLVMNARDAMTAAGELRVELEQRSVQSDGLGAPLDLAPGLYNVLTVADSGIGMPAEVAAKAFEPFFTTKERGHGTGLGLAMVYGFARQSGGTATLFSQLGLGTTVRLYLPAIVGQDAELGAMHISRSSKVETPQTEGSKSGERILVVDDEEVLLDATCEQLKRLGYRVMKSALPAEALDQLRTHPFDMLFSDVTMTGMSGIELAKQAIALQPGIRIVLMSGFAAEALHTDWPILEKPFSRSQLGQIVRLAFSEPL